MPLPGLPYPKDGPFQKSGDESRHAQKLYGEGMNQAGVDGDQEGAQAGGGALPSAPDQETQCMYQGGRESRIPGAKMSKPKSGMEPGPGGDAEQDG